MPILSRTSPPAAVGGRPTSRNHLILLLRWFRNTWSFWILIAVLAWNQRSSLLSTNPMYQYVASNLLLLEKVADDGAFVSRSNSNTPTATTARVGAEDQQQPQTRRSRAHFCHWPAHNKQTVEMLRSEFNFSDVDATKQDFDLIYGGYPHCGRKRMDWKMETGLFRDFSDQGWENVLQPHHVVYPCMGCRSSFCNKWELCALIRQSHPHECFVLPQDYERLVTSMNHSNSNNNIIKWVRKVDGPNLHMHLGNGVAYIQNASELPSPSELKTFQQQGEYYIVQPYHKPLVIPGNLLFQRKVELKIYLSITSVTPLRVYAHSSMGIVLSPGLWDPSNNDPCMHTTSVMACKWPLKSNHSQWMSFDEYATGSHMTAELQHSIRQDALELLSSVIQNSLSMLQQEEVNRGVTETGAMCFTHYRADLGITAQGKAVLYEINEFPFVGGKGKALEFKQNIFRDLFHLIGLDQPPVPVEDRAAFEAAHAGGWRLLPNL